MTEPSKTVGIVGGGVSAIATAIILQKGGHRVILFEKANKVGGIWAVSYDHATLQNIREQYCFSDFPWPEKPALHPTGHEIREYLKAAIEHFNIDLRLGHEVVRLTEGPAGWDIQVNHTGEAGERITHHAVDFVIASIGQYTDGKNRPVFLGEDVFQGEIMTERNYHSKDTFVDKDVVVVGYGKSALDMTTFAGTTAKQVYHVFRTPRWTLPLEFFGIHYSHALFSRFGTVLMTSWVHPTKLERWLHRNLGGVVLGFWKNLGGLVRTLAMRSANGQGPQAKERVRTALPDHEFVNDFRSATAMQPPQYFPMVARGTIEPHRDEIESFTKSGIRLKSGQEIAANVVVLSVGSQSPRFPFLPEPYRVLLEQEKDGVQLYRHLIHPDIPNFAFAGYNHGFMHIAAVEVGAVWLHALMTGDMILPNKDQMLSDIAEVTAWKRAHVHYEPSRLCAVATRFQQYIDVMLKELQVSPYRKGNPLAEIFGRYLCQDYVGVYEEYAQKKAKRNQPLTPLLLST